MSDNINRLLVSGKQKYLNYEVRQPYKVKGHKIAQGLSMMTSQAEYLKTGFNYPSYKLFDPYHQYEKNIVPYYPEMAFCLDFSGYLFFNNNFGVIIYVVFFEVTLK